MALDTKTLEELELLANNLFQQIRLRPRQSKLEEVELREVEEWIVLRRKERSKACGSCATSSG